MKNSISFITIIFLLLSCNREEPPEETHRLPKIVFDPNIERFEGIPGEELKLKVKIERAGEKEGNFNLLTLERIEKDNFITTDTLAYSPEGFSTPYFYDHQIILKEDDIDNDYQLKFLISSKITTPSGGTLFSSGFKSLSVHTGY